MELWVYAPNGKLKGVLDAATSLRWRRKYYEPGEFELHLQATPANIALCQTENMLHRPDCKETMLVEARTLHADELTVTGRSLSCCLGFAAITGIHQYSNTNYQDIMHDLVNRYHQYAQPLTTRLVKSAADAGEPVGTQISHKLLGDVLTSLSRASNIGVRMYLDPAAVVDTQLGQWVFETYTGRSRAIEFSDDYDNADPTYTYDSTACRNWIYVLGDGEGGNRALETIHTDSFTTRRRETIVDAKDVQRPEEDPGGAAYRKLLYQRGYEKAAEMIVSESIASDINTNVQWVYRADYDLGDVVAIRSHQWGLAIEKRITEIEEVYEKGAGSVSLVFGDPLPDKLNLSALTG